MSLNLYRWTVSLSLPADLIDVCAATREDAETLALDIGRRELQRAVRNLTVLGCVRGECVTRGAPDPVDCCEGQSLDDRGGMPKEEGS